MAAGDLVTVDEARKYLRLEDPLDDEILAGLISASSAFFKTETGRDLLAADYTETFCGEWARGVFPRQFPVLSVTSVKLDGEAVAAWTLVSGEGWVLNRDRLDFLGPKFAGFLGYAPASWDYSTVSYGNVGVRNIEVQYRAGYETIPADLKQAVIEHVALRYRDRDWGPQNYRLVGGEVVDRRGGESGTLAYIRSVIERYRRRTW